MYPTFTGMMPLSKVNALKGLSGAALDKAFIDLMIEQYKEVISLQSGSGEGSGVRYGEILKLRAESVKTLNERVSKMEQIKKERGY